MTKKTYSSEEIAQSAYDRLKLLPEDINDRAIAAGEPNMVTTGEVAQTLQTDAASVIKAVAQDRRLEITQYVKQGAGRRELPQDACQIRLSGIDGVPGDAELQAEPESPSVAIPDGANNSAPISDEKPVIGDPEADGE